MSELRQRRPAVLGAALVIVAAALVWCAVHIRYDVLISQQPCEMSYTFAAYAPVEMPSTAGTNQPEAPARRATNPRPRPPASDWARNLTAVTSRVVVAAATFGRWKYQLWRYTGESHNSQGQQGGGSSGLALPVLFIPGNGGSHEMGRSLGSETARRVSRLGPRAGPSADVHWYLLDLEGEWSAFEGATLERQVEFALTAMRYLARVYDITPAASRAAAGPQVHPGLVVVGHSMGGVVAADALARAAIEPDLGPSLVALLLTLGSPHARPALPGHPSLTAFYQTAAARPRPAVPVVAMAGGMADFQVTSELTDPAALAPEGFTRHMVFPDVPGAWCPSVHNALVWCNQVAVQLAQALVELAQEALPGLEAARKAAVQARTAAAPKALHDAAGAPSGAGPLGLDEATWREAHKDDSAVHAPTGAAAAAKAAAGATVSARLGWDWALRAFDRHLRHPSQAYLAAAVATAAAVEGAAAAAVEARDEVVRRAQSASAPSADGGAGCTGANLAWYLQYDKPQPRRRRTALRLSSRDVEALPSTGRMYSWQLARRTSTGTATEDTAGGLASRGWVAVVSGASPCSAFRAWLSVTVERAAVAAAASTAAADGDAADGSSRERLEALEAEARRSLASAARTVRHDVEVTGLAAPLPAVVAAGRWPVRDRADGWDIVGGRDYQVRGAWLLLLPPSLVLPLLQRLPGAPPLDLGLYGNGGGANITVTLTVWLGGPSYSPAFRLVAAPIMSEDQQGEARRRSPLLQLLPPIPRVASDELAAATAAATVTSPPPMLVSLALPYMPAGAGSPWPSWANALAAAAVHWLGLYKYAAVRVMNLDARPALGAPAAATGSSADTADACLYPVVILVGGGGGSEGRRNVLDRTHLLKASVNRTLHSLEPCAADPRGCSAVAVVLDPACSYSVDLVPYSSQRLQALLQAHAVELWLGAQLAALLAVAAAAAAAPGQRPEQSKDAGSEAPTAEAEKAATAGANGQKDGESGRECMKGNGGRWQRRFRGWPALPSEGLFVLQAGPWQGPAAAALLASTASAAALLALTAAMALTTQDGSVVAVGSAAREKALFGGMAARTATNGAVVEAVARMMMAVSSSWWPQLRALAVFTGLCPRSHLDGCGWGPSLVAAAAEAAGWSPVAAAAAVEPGSGGGGGGGATAAGPLSALDWAALAAVAVLLMWLLTAVLQAAATVVAGLEAAVLLVVTLPYTIVTMPLRLLPPALGLRRQVGRTGGGGELPEGAVPGSNGDSTQVAAGTALRWAARFASLAAVVTLTGGAPSALPGLALLVSVLSLAAALSSPAAVLPPALNTGATTVPQSSTSQDQQQLRRRLQERRRRLAWLLYYAAYGMCAVPAVPASLRRLAVRQAERQQLGEALHDAAAALLELLLNGRALDVLKLGLSYMAAAAAWVPGAAGVGDVVAVAVAGVGGQVGYLLAASHCGALAYSATAASTGPMAAAAVSTSRWRRPQRPEGPASWLAARAGQVVLEACCILLALAWWLRAPAAAHCVAGAVAAGQLAVLVLLPRP